MANEMKISSISRKRLGEQGYRGFDDSDLSRHRLGIRFAYFACMSVVVAGLVFGSQPLLLLANAIAFLGIFPPYHPIDYLYNYGIRHFLSRPKLPPRANQSRFACFMATVMLAIINYFLYLGNFTVVYIVGAMLLTSAFLVTFLDICIPSKIYNALFERRAEDMQNESRPAEAGSRN